MATAKPVALVTGGANGIGRAIAQHLLAAGWRVGIIDRPGSGLKRAFSPRDRNVALFEGDVREEESISRAVKMFVAQFGRLDAVVSNAGIMIRKPLRRLTLAEWHRVIDTNLTAAFLLARAAERPLRKARGAIVLIASTRALVWSRTRNPIRRRRAGWSRSATRSPSASARTCASIASAPAGSQPGIMARCAARITRNIPSAASVSRRTSPRSSPGSSMPSVRASSPALILLSTDLCGLAA
jgi:NAD(P)-dependent dehydrogenase (short-subunit alcohol dehydrogenase family)